MRLIRPEAASLADSHAGLMQLYDPSPCPDDIFVHVTAFGTALYAYGLDPHLSGRPHSALPAVLGRLVHFRLGYNDRGSCCEAALLATLPHAVHSQLKLAASVAAAGTTQHANAGGGDTIAGVGTIVVPPGLRCTFDDTSAGALGVAMKCGSGITQIDLAGCSCMSVGLRVMCTNAGAALRQLRSIDLSDQWLLAAGATKIPGAMSLGAQLQAEARTAPGFRPSTMPISALQKFLVRWTGVLTDDAFTEAMGSGDGLQALADVLVAAGDGGDMKVGVEANGDPPHCQLQTLKLNSIGTFTPSHASAWQPIWHALPSLSELRHLELGGNAFAEVALGGLRNALQQATQLHTIGLGHPTVTVPLCTAGLRTLASTPYTGRGSGYCVGSGLHLDLSHAQLTASDACIIADALEALKVELVTRSGRFPNTESQNCDTVAECFLTSLDLSYNVLTSSVAVKNDGVQQLLVHQLGTPVQALGEVDHLEELLAAASQLPTLTNLSLAYNSLDAGDTLSVAPSILSAVLRIGALDLSGNNGTDEGGEVREALALLTAGLQGLSWCKVMDCRLGADSCARLLPPDLVQTIADLVTPTPILVEMLMFGQPAVGVAERAPLSQTELDEGDEFFEQCQDWMGASPGHSAYGQTRHSAYGLPAQMQHNHTYYHHRHHYRQQMVASVPWNPAAGMHIHAQEATELDAELDAAFDQFLRESGQA